MFRKAFLSIERGVCSVSSTLRSHWEVKCNTILMPRWAVLSFCHQSPLWYPWPVWLLISSVSTYPLSIFMAFLRVILGFSVSGQKSLATARDAGADMTEAVSKCVDDTCGEGRGWVLLGSGRTATPSMPRALGVRGQDRDLCHLTPHWEKHRS